MSGGYIGTAAADRDPVVGNAEIGTSKISDDAVSTAKIQDDAVTAAKLANATVLNLISNKFEPQGVTAIALLAESHLSIHSWPEAHYSAVDIFTCGQNMKPEISCNYLAIIFA